MDSFEKACFPNIEHVSIKKLHPRAHMKRHEAYTHLVCMLGHVRSNVLGAHRWRMCRPLVICSNI